MSNYFFAESLILDQLQNFGNDFKKISTESSINVQVIDQQQLSHLVSQYASNEKIRQPDIT
jgi:hypothetical protein